MAPIEAAELDDSLRDDLYKAVYEEFVGPQDFYAEQYLKRSPLEHYAAGVLHPKGASFHEYEDRQDAGENRDGQSSQPLQVGDVPRNSSFASSSEDNTEEEPISMSNARRQSAISMTIALQPNDNVIIEASSAIYTPIKTEQEGSRYERKAFVFPLTSEDFTMPQREGELTKMQLHEKGLELWIVFRRRIAKGNVLTIALCNVSDATDRADNCFFQASLRVSSELGLVPPTWPGPSQTPLSEEEEAKQLIYRHIRNYAIGHGCATRWEKSDVVRWAQTQVMPWAETHPMMTLHPSMQGISLSLKSFSDAKRWQETREAISNMCANYEQWILKLETETSTLEKEYMPAANRNIAQCRLCLSRIRKGLNLLESDETARQAFILMNEVMYDQYLHYSVVSGERKALDKEEPDRSWRPFQLAFIVMNVRSIVDEQCDERSIVDLIWFPTGGGKTEAYLGLSAFILIWERLNHCCSAGVSVIMRYTLRLLTSQQFDRASSLICALESKRRKNPKLLGDREFRIGLWVGGDASPNKREDAEAARRDFCDKNGVKNPFPVRFCPWCGTNLESNKRRSYRRIGKGARLSFFCPNELCEYSKGDGLPLDVVDEEIYERPPSLLVGTVDKFAMLPYRNKALKLFGITNGSFEQPPKLIIQDELHLISGPLGSMAAHYETLVSDLCSRRGRNGSTHPKIIASTATVSRAKEQCNQLYACGEENVFQFPPSGINYDDSFFSMEDSKGRGRRYVGVFVPDLTSATASIRLYADLLWEPVTWKDVPDEWIDRYWSIIGYYGTTRELGQAVTWMGGDIPERLREHRRKAKDAGLELARYVNVGKELTGRKDADEVKAGLDSLKISYPDKNAVDLCFATNMISVGLDVGRLGVMVVAGQPKSTAEYIQATSRVGRSESKGIVFVVYNPNKPRDRSHYENFAMYHESFYQDVEPSSVTAFCQQVRERALVGTLIGMYRSITDSPDDRSFANPDEEAFDYAANALRDRVKKVDPDESRGLEQDLQDIYKWWSECDYDRWDELRPEGLLAPTPLMHPWGGETLDAWGGAAFDVPTSLRSVDKECHLAIVGSYGGYSPQDEGGHND